jgi:hypothetical protein
MWASSDKRMCCPAAGMRDDPYRSLAALVRKSGGYEKSTRPFSEFVWANHFRCTPPATLALAGGLASLLRCAGPAPGCGRACRCCWIDVTASPCTPPPQA